MGGPDSYGGEGGGVGEDYPSSDPVFVGPLFRSGGSGRGPVTVTLFRRFVFEWGSVRSGRRGKSHGSTWGALVHGREGPFCGAGELIHVRVAKESEKVQDDPEPTGRQMKTARDTFIVPLCKLDEIPVPGMRRERTGVPGPVP